MITLAEKLAETRQRISSAVSAAGRLDADVTLIVVTKNHPAQLALDLFALGERNFGENRDQEASPKSQEVSLALGSAADAGYNWHFVGQLQTNKAKSVLQYASTIHSLDRDSLLKELGKCASQRREVEPGFELDVFIQLNLTDDPARGGIQAADLKEFSEKTGMYEGINVLGVMGVASLAGSVEKDFSKIVLASEVLKSQIPSANYISAGMSDDFELAIAYGATHLRVGTAITGNRPQTA